MPPWPKTYSIHPEVIDNIAANDCKTNHLSDFDASPFTPRVVSFFFMVGDDEPFDSLTRSEVGEDPLVGFTRDHGLGIPSTSRNS